jgi:hypothetical protein
LQVLLDHNGIVPQYVKAHQKYTESGCNAEQADVEATNFVLPNEQTLEMTQVFVPYGHLLVMHGWKLHAGAAGKGDRAGLRLHCYTKLRVGDTRKKVDSTFSVSWLVNLSTPKFAERIKYGPQS